MTDVPAGYLTVSSGLGQSSASQLLLAPASIDGVVQAVIELGFFRDVTAPEQELVDRASEVLGVAVRSAKDRSQLESLLEETQQQRESLQTQQEELRVSNEELEEQSRVAAGVAGAPRIAADRRSSTSTRSSRSRPRSSRSRRTCC